MSRFLENLVRRGLGEPPMEETILARPASPAAEPPTEPGRAEPWEVEELEAGNEKEVAEVLRVLTERPPTPEPEGTFPRPSPHQPKPVQDLSGASEAKPKAALHPSQPLEAQTPPRERERAIPEPQPAEPGPSSDRTISPTPPAPVQVSEPRDQAAPLLPSSVPVEADKRVPVEQPPNQAHGSEEEPRQALNPLPDSPPPSAVPEAKGRDLASVGSHPEPRPTSREKLVRERLVEKVVERIEERSERVEVTPAEGPQPAPRERDEEAAPRGKPESEVYPTPPKPRPTETRQVAQEPKVILKPVPLPTQAAPTVQRPVGSVRRPQAPSRTIDVHIGSIEIRTASKPDSPPPPVYEDSTAAEPAGFEEYRDLRNYSRWFRG